MKKALLIVFILTSLNFLIRIPHLNIPLDRDEGAYAYIGWRWISYNELPYTNTFDHKSPIIYLPFGLSSYIFGHDETYIRLFVFIYSSATLISLYKLSRQTSTTKFAFLATCIATFYFGSNLTEGRPLQPETLALLPTSILANILIKKSTPYSNKNLFLMGIIISLVISIKLSLVFIVMFLIVSLLSHQPNKKTLLLLTLSLSLIPFSFLLYFHLNNSLPQVLNLTLFYNHVYVSDATSSQGVCANASATLLNCALNWLFRIHIFILPIFFLSAFYWVLNYKNPKTKFLFGLFLATWCTTKVSGGRDYAHYYLLWLIPLTPCLAATFEFISKKISKLTLFFVVLMIFVWMSSLESYFYIYTKNNTSHISNQFHLAQKGKDIGQLIKNYVPENDSIFVWQNEPSIYFYSQRRSENENINFFKFYTTPNQEISYRSILNKKPTWIVSDYQVFCINNYFHKNIERITNSSLFYLQENKYQLVVSNNAFGLYKLSGL